MNIGIICATREEIKPFLEQEKTETLKKGSNPIYRLQTGAQQIYIYESGIGKINATIASMELINVYQCRSILFSGVGGGLNSNTKKGILTIAKNISQHDMDISAFGYKKGETKNNREITTNRDMRQQALVFSKKHNIQIHERNLTTGDQFIHSKEQKEYISRTFSADLIDMESYAIAATCTRYSIPYAIIRTVSDSAGIGAKQDFQKNVEQASKKSADFTLGMIRFMGEE